MKLLNRTLLVFLFFSLTACFFGGKGELGNFLNGSGVKTGGLGGGFNENAYISSVGILTHQGIFENMSKLTTIPVTNASVRAVYNRVKSSLPQKYGLRYFGSSSQKAVNVLAAEFCDVMATNNQALSTVVPNYNPDGNLDSSEISYLSQRLADHFWGYNIKEKDKKLAIKDLEQLLVELQTGGQSEENVFFAACTTTLSSLPVISL